ncbi:MAG: hypothetical protein EBU49_05465 [Proteobacteria bacterium]|nr:hypothetical protein [Pseudomonadota bacterium]
MIIRLIALRRFTSVRSGFLVLKSMCSSSDPSADRITFLCVISFARRSREAGFRDYIGNASLEVRRSIFLSSPEQDLNGLRHDLAPGETRICFQQNGLRITFTPKPGVFWEPWAAVESGLGRVGDVICRMKVIFEILFAGLPNFRFKMVWNWT